MSALPISPDPRHTLTPSGNLRRRQAISKFFVGATVGAAGLAVAVLFILIYYAAKHGASQMSLSFLGGTLPEYGGIGGGGGIGPALVGTLELVVIATVIALPVGLLTALYISEFAGPRLGRAMKMALEQMAGLPTIIVGIFVAGLIVNHLGQSAFAGSLALSIVEVPLIARASIESISRVPPTLREAADALGVARWRTIVGVVLPTSSNGIVTATILAIARAAGETAPVLFTTALFVNTYQLNPGKPVAPLPLLILQLLESGQSTALDKAWGAAFVLMVLILLINIGARVWLRRSERKRGL